MPTSRWGQFDWGTGAWGINYWPYTGEAPLSLTPESTYTQAWTADVALANKLLVWVTYLLKNALALYRDFILKNALTDGITRDFVLVNKLREAASKDYILKNELLAAATYATRDFTVHNVLEEDPAVRLIQNTWTVKVGTTDITDKVFSPITMDLDEGAFCNQIDLEVGDLDLLTTLEANRGSGKDVLVITIGSTEYKFLIEDVGISRKHPETRISVWGRSKTAILADPMYSNPITKVWEATSKASTIITELAGSLTVDNQLEDWIIHANTLSAERQMPIDILRRIAGVQGGVIRSSPDGKLILRPRKTVTPAQLSSQSPDVTLYDFDDLLTMDDRRELSEGWNAVTVKGRTTSVDEPALIIVLDGERNNGKTIFEPGEEAFVRVYRRPLDLEYTSQVTLGTATKLGTFTQTITDEEIVVTDGVAWTAFPIKSVTAMDFDGRVLSGPQYEVGGQDIRFTVAAGCSGSAYLKLDYKTQYDLWKVKVTSAGTAILCLEDDAA